MNQREASRQNWSATGQIQEINSGSLQRIADATEKMAASYDYLREDRDRYKRRYQEETLRREKRDRQVAALRGAITRMKRKEAGQ